jgi:hypothetical protein
MKWFAGICFVVCCGEYVEYIPAYVEFTTSCVDFDKVINQRLLWFKVDLHWSAYRSRRGAAQQAK